MAKAVRIHKIGGPEILRYEDINIAEPDTGEVRIKQTACGLNFIDIYHRTGLYPLALPSTIGLEAAGVIDAVGDDVHEFKEGDRVAYAALPVGAYTDHRVIAARHIVKLPDSISNIQAAAMMLQGMTVEYLIRRTYEVKANDTVLIHAAAGGVGLIACQWLKQLDATVIGTVGSQEKADLAKAHGCDHTIFYNNEDVAAKVRDITDGKGVPVVYDSVGATTFDGSLNSLAPRGVMVSFGNASGPVPPFKPSILAQKGSLYFTRPTLMTYTAKRTDLVQSANSLFEAVSKGLRIKASQTYPLKDIAEAHKALEARKTTGSTVLIP